jgi:hypothetical protein
LWIAWIVFRGVDSTARDSNEIELDQSSFEALLDELAVAAPLGLQGFGRRATSRLPG